MYDVMKRKLTDRLVETGLKLVIVAILGAPLAMILTPKIEPQCTAYSDEGSDPGQESCVATAPWFSFGTDPHDASKRVYIPLSFFKISGDDTRLNEQIAQNRAYVRR